MRNLYALALAAALTIMLPEGEVWWACRRPLSEGCVWGKALLPVNFTATAIIVGIPAFLLARRFLR